MATALPSSFVFRGLQGGVRKNTPYEVALTDYSGAARYALSNVQYEDAAGTDMGILPAPGTGATVGGPIETVYNWKTFSFFWNATVGTASVNITYTVPAGTIRVIESGVSDTSTPTTAMDQDEFLLGVPPHAGNIRQTALFYDQEDGNQLASLGFTILHEDLEHRAVTGPETAWWQNVTAVATLRDKTSGDEAEETATTDIDSLTGWTALGENSFTSSAPAGVFGEDTGAVSFDTHQLSVTAGSRW